MKKYKFNEDKFLRNIAIISGLGAGIALIVKIANCGIAWLSTTGLFG